MTKKKDFSATLKWLEMEVDRCPQARWTPASVAFEQYVADGGAEPRKAFAKLFAQHCADLGIKCAVRRGVKGWNVTLESYLAAGAPENHTPDPAPARESHPARKYKFDGPASNPVAWAERRADVPTDLPPVRRNVLDDATIKSLKSRNTETT